MGSGGGGTQNTTATPWEGVQPFLLDAYDRLSSAFANPPEYYPDSTVAPRSDTTMQGISATAAAAQPQKDVAQQTGEQFGFFTKDALSPDTNQYLAQTAQAAIKPVMESLRKDVLPDLGRGAVEVGGFGGTAHANLNENAIDTAVQRALDDTFALYSSAYESGADRATDLLKASPIIQGTFAAPGASLVQAGGMEDLYSQNVLNDLVNRWNFGQTAEQDSLTQYINTLLGVPFGTSTSMTGMGPSDMQAGLAGAAGGLALQSMFPALAMSQPWMLPLIIGGGAALFN